VFADGVSANSTTSAVCNLCALNSIANSPFEGMWLGGTLAMTTKGALAMLLGVKLRDRLPQRTLRTLASASCCVLGVLALGGIIAR